MDPNLLSMIWWRIPALAGFALMFCSAVALAWLAFRRSEMPQPWIVAAVLFVASQPIAWTCNAKAHAYGRLWCGAESETAAAAVEGVR